MLPNRGFIRDFRVLQTQCLLGIFFTVNGWSVKLSPKVTRLKLPPWEITWFLSGYLESLTSPPTKHF